MFLKLLETTMNNMNEVTIFITEQEAIQFRTFQQNYSKFMLLVNSGVFDIKNGSAVLHFDNSGTIQKIDRHDPLFDAKFK